MRIRYTLPGKDTDSLKQETLEINAKRLHFCFDSNSFQSCHSTPFLLLHFIAKAVSDKKKLEWLLNMLTY